MHKYRLIALFLLAVAAPTRAHAVVFGPLIAAAYDMLSWIAVAVTVLLVSATMAILLLYIFMGWIKAMLGIAFMPFTLMVFPLDKGRMLSGALSFCLGAVASFVFSLAVGLMGLAALLTGAEAIKAATIRAGQAVAGGAAPSGIEISGLGLAMAIMMAILSALILLVVFNAKSWGAEFFGSSSFDVSMPRMRLAKGGGGGGGRSKSDHPPPPGGAARAGGGGGGAGGAGGQQAPSRAQAAGATAGRATTAAINNVRGSAAARALGRVRGS